MKFEVVRDRGYERVNAVPSDPNGHFVVSDPFCGNIKRQKIALDGVKGRHIRALQAGDNSDMQRYTWTDPDEPDVLQFTNRCSPGIPDPLQPIGTSIYAGNAREVPPPPPEDMILRPEKRRRWWQFGRDSRDAQRVLASNDELAAFAYEVLHPYQGTIEDLKPIEEATTAHEAVGSWWAQRVLNLVFDIGDGHIVTPELPAEVRTAYELKIGGFAAALASLSADDNVDYISVDYRPDRVLREAAALSDLPLGDATFPWKSHTHIQDGIVSARAGRSAPTQQIWPISTEQ